MFASELLFLLFFGGRQIQQVYRKPGPFPQDVKLYIQRCTAQESWNFVKFIHHLKSLSQYPVPTVLNFVGCVPTQNSSPSVECYYGWKLATLNPWRSLDDLCAESPSFKAAFDHL